MYGLAQTLRRRAGQDPLNSLTDKDVTVLLCAFHIHHTVQCHVLAVPAATKPEKQPGPDSYRYPPPKGNTIATEQTWKQAKKKHRIAQAFHRQQAAQDGTSSATEWSVYERKKPRMIWPEERLMWDVYRRSPELKNIPYNLNSFEPPFAKRFALRQHELMQQGMTKEAAYRDTEQEMAMHKQELLKCVSM